MVKTLWWLSFATEDAFLGACIVEAPDFRSALVASHAKGLNPGGECKGYEIDPLTQVADKDIHVFFKTVEEIEAALGPVDKF